jgi:hypothetical protein
MAFTSDKPNWWCNLCGIKESGEIAQAKILYERAEKHSQENKHDTYFQNWYGRSRIRPNWESISQ